MGGIGFGLKVSGFTCRASGLALAPLCSVIVQPSAKEDFAHED